MFIESIELLNYRNYKQLHMDFHSGTNVLYGDNAQGKTISWKPFMYAAPPSPIKGARIRRSSGSGRRNPILR